MRTSEARTHNEISRPPPPPSEHRTPESPTAMERSEEEDFPAGTPPPGAAPHDSAESPAEPDDPVPPTDGGTKQYHLNARYAFVTWSRSTFTDAGAFHAALIALLPPHTQIYGGQEHHADGHPHFHAVFKFAHKVHWRNARARFRVPHDTAAVHIDHPRARQPVALFLARAQRYCEKGGRTFGARIAGDGAAAAAAGEERKRRHAEVEDEPDYDAAKAMMRAHDPVRFIHNYRNIMAYMDGEKTRKRRRPARKVDYEPRPWVLPEAIRDWQARFIDGGYVGRPTALIIVGPPKTGKTEWANSIGAPCEMSTRWNMKAMDPECTHLVVSDASCKRFGFAGDSYWREILGCQMSFDARDFQEPTRRIEWGKPAIWTCNADLDPRKVKGVREYVEVACVVVEIDRPLFAEV